MPSDRRSLPCTMLSLKKYLKRARLFEVQKLTKRIRAAEKKRGTELQLAKNQRKVQRLQHELELVKDVDIGELCSRIQANDIQTIRLATQKQAPADSLEEKAKWRLLSSKTVRGYLEEFMKVKDKGESSSCVSIRRDGSVPECDRQRSTPRVSYPATSGHSTLVEERGGEQCVSDERGVDYSTIDRKAGSSRNKGMNSVFLTSLSGIEEGTDKKQPHKKRKALVRRNRLGQRARRKLWEEKYGGTAKHLGKTKAKRTRTKTRVSGLTREAHSLREMHGRSGESKSLHPSWTAKKQQQTTIQQFQGQKITFDSE